MREIPKHFLVFVPGIMGTELFHNYERHGTKLRRQLWGGTGRVILYSLVWHPRALTRPDIESGQVIRNISTGIPFSTPINVYAPILSYLTDTLGYTENQNFAAFGYDWRNDIRESARKL